MGSPPVLPPSQPKQWDVWTGAGCWLAGLNLMTRSN